jgi:hypothetical protein
MLKATTIPTIVSEITWRSKGLILAIVVVALFAASRGCEDPKARQAEITGEK